MVSPVPADACGNYTNGCLQKSKGGSYPALGFFAMPKQAKVQQ